MCISWTRKGLVLYVIVLVIFTYVRDAKEHGLLQHCSRGFCSSGIRRCLRGNKIRSKRLDPITPDAALYPRKNGILNPDALELNPLRHKDLWMLCCLLKDTVCTRANSRISVKVPQKKDWNFNWSIMKHSACFNVRAPNTTTTGLVKFTLEQVTKAQDGVGGQRYAPAALPRERDPVPTV